MFHRIIIKLDTSNSERIYVHCLQTKLTEFVHQVLLNQEEIKPFLGSFSNLRGLFTRVEKHLQFMTDTELIINCYDSKIIDLINKHLQYLSPISSESTQEIVTGFAGMIIKGTSLETLQDNVSTVYFPASPVVVRELVQSTYEYIIAQEDRERCESILTRQAIKKMEDAGINPIGVRVQLVPNDKEKTVRVNVLDGFVMANRSPVYLEGTPEQVKFLRCVGVGSMQEYGFGALK